MPWRAQKMNDVVKQYEEMEKNFAVAKAKVADLEKQIAGGQQSFVGSDERRLMRAFACPDLKSLLTVNTASKRFAGVSITDKLAVCELKKDIDVARWYAQVVDGASLDRGEMDKSNEVSVVKNIFNTRYAKESDLLARVKAFGTGVTNGGAEYIETAISASYIDEYLLEKKVANTFQEIPMPTNPFKLPIVQEGTVARIVAEGTNATDASFTTDAMTFDAANKLVELYNLPEELNEDSAVAFLSLGREKVLQSQLSALETAIINGDTTGTHMDSNVTAASDARKAWKGLRKLALANSANGSVVDFGGAVSDTKVDEMLAASGKFGINPREALFIVSSQIYHQMAALDKVTTVDNFGPMATILTGLLAAYRGRGIITSEYVWENLNASGVYDGITMTKGTMLLVNKTRFFLGRRRPIRIRVAMDARAEYDRWQLVSYQRADFQGMTQSATEKSVIVGINITL